MRNNKLYIYSFYKFVKILNKISIKCEFEKVLNKINLKGTIILADEGINGSISGNKNDLNYFLETINRILEIKVNDIKINRINTIPFNRMKVRLKKEIVSLGVGEMDINRDGGSYIDPEDWDSMILHKNTQILDVRNNFEIEIGKFKNAIRSNTKSFREFPKTIENLKISKDQPIAMYCTGGIRCEKASAYLKKQGYSMIYQLKGGIINYLEYHKKKEIGSNWQGECFVFDDRVTINKNLEKGKYLQCYACRHPIRDEHILSKEYKKGVSCPYCFHERSDLQKSKSRSRQIQIELAKKNKGHSIFLK